MKITIDTPYMTPGEFARRAGLSERSVQHKIDQGMILIRKKNPGQTKGSVFINMIYLAMEATEQAERVLSNKSKTKTAGNE